MNCSCQNERGGWFAPGKPLAPLRFPVYCAIWISTLISQLGFMIQWVAAGWLITELTTSHRLIATVQVSVTMSIMFLGILSGAIADNFDRRRIMLVAQIEMLMVSIVLAVVTFEEIIGPYSLLALSVLIGMGAAINGPAWQASVRSQVQVDDLPQAISLNTIAFNLARSVGPALGGLVISFWNIGVAFLLNALSYVPLIIVLLRWRPQPRSKEPHSIYASIVSGLRYCMTTGPVRNVLLRGATIGFGASAYVALLPTLVRNQLGGNEISFGLLQGVYGVGSIIFAMISARIWRSFGSEATIGFSMIALACSNATLAFSQGLEVAMPAVFIGGAGWVMVLITLNVTIQVLSPDEILGRCLSIYQTVTFGSMAIGAWTWGAIADWHNIPMALQLSAAWLLVSFFVLRLIAPIRNL